MSKAFLWTDLISSIPEEATQDLEHFLTFSELRTGRPLATEERLLETLSLSLTRRNHVN